MTSSEAALLLGKHRNFFATLKCTSREQYDHILTLNGVNLYEKYTAYLEEQKTVLDALADEYYWLEDNKLISNFSEIVYKIGIMTHKNSFASGASQVIFNIGGSFYSYHVYVRYKRILIALLKFKERRKTNEQIY